MLTMNLLKPQLIAKFVDCRYFLTNRVNKDPLRATEKPDWNAREASTRTHIKVGLRKPLRDFWQSKG